MPGSNIWHYGVRMYKSKDLYNWEDLGLVLPPVLDDPQNPLNPGQFMDRPHILFCADLTSDYTDVSGYYSTHFPRISLPYVREAPDWSKCSVLGPLRQQNTSLADYVWLPVRFDGEMAYLDWREEWRHLRVVQAHARPRDGLPLYFAGREAHSETGNGPGLW
ncbi:MAG: hypothetical protein ACOYOU_15895 [Kiritimatiellia bacterium]